MKYIARRFRLKSGNFCMLRSPEPEDAAQRIDFLRRVNIETDFMARGAEDSPADEMVVAELLAEQLEDDASVEIAAFVGEKMVACGAIGPVARAYPRKRHRASLGVCVLGAYWGQGLGTALLHALATEAEKLGYAQIELSVANDNVRARALYARCGFTETGRIPNALRYDDGGSQDEIWMVRRLNSATAPD